MNSFAHAWVLLGHVLAAQEESEHAISAYRTACRVSPGDLHPQLAMAKEQVLAVPSVPLQLSICFSPFLIFVSLPLPAHLRV